jgi:hypothetical protein
MLNSTNRYKVNLSKMHSGNSKATIEKDLAEIGRDGRTDGG